MSPPEETDGGTKAKAASVAEPTLVEAAAVAEIWLAKPVTAGNKCRAMVSNRFITRPRPRKRFSRL